MHALRFLALCSLVIPLGGAALHAQATTSRLVGTVTDESGGIIPGATVTATNDGTGVTFTTVTTSAGTYVFEALQVGLYTVTVELQGFKKFVSTGNPVSIGEPATVNARLTTGTVAETVEVTASSELVQTGTSGNFGTTFDQRTIESLPIIGSRGRNVLNLVLTQPGVVSGANTGGGVHVNGARDRSWNFTLDGIDTNESSAGGSNFSPLRTNPDSLAEFRVLTGNVTAEMGRNSGGQVTMVTRSGTNNFSGTLFYFDQRPEYNANEWENNINGVRKRQFFQKMPGFSLGGPIKRNKAFFFVNAQWLLGDLTNIRTRTVYTEQARRGLWRHVVGARTLPAGVSGASVDTSGNPLPGVAIGTYNIPGSDPLGLGLDPTIQALLNRTPLPNNFTVGDGLNLAGYTWAAPEQERQNDWVAKIDHAFNAAHSAFVRYARGYQNTNCDQVNGGEPTFPGGDCLVNTERSPSNWAANYRWSPGGASVVNELVVGQNHFTFDFLNPRADPSKPTFIGLQVSNPDDFTVGNLRTIDTYQVVDNFSWVRGRHAMKFGLNARLQRHTDNRGSVAGLNVAPRLDFSTSVNSVDPATFGIPANMQVANDRPAAQAAVNLLLGRVGTISQGFVQSGGGYAPGGTTFRFEAWFPELDLYAQDTWTVRPGLTVDLGLRWEYKGTPSNPDDLIRRPNQSMAVGQTPSSTVRWEQGALYDSDWNNVSPSIGLVWDPRGDGKTALRGNYRLAYDRINTFVLSSNIFQSIPGISVGVTDVAFGQAGGRLRFGLPGLQPTASPESYLQPPAVSANSIRVVDPEFQSPLTHGWAFSYQHELPGRMVLEAAYVGRRAEHLFGAYNVNQAEYRSNGFLDAFNIVKAGGESPLMNQLLAADTRRLANESGSAMVRRLFAPTLALNGVASLAASIGTRFQAGRTMPDLAGLGPYFFFPYPQFLGGVNVIDSEDYSRYHALELKLERRFTTGYGWLIGYTLARSKDTRSYDPTFTVVSTGNLQSASSTPFDIFDRSLNFATSDFDRTHVLQGQWVIELPFGHGRRFGANVNRAVDAVIGGWQIAGQTRISSGRPFTVYSGSNTFSNVVQSTADCAGCTPPTGAVHEENGVLFYFDPAERARFSTPSAGQLGNTGRNFFRGPRFATLDLSVAKRSRVVGSQILEFRMDATNLTNSPSFGFPTATVTAATFGRIRDSVVSFSRQIMIGAKYYF